MTIPKNTGMRSVGDILKNFNPTKDKYVSREFQTFGVFLAEKLDDIRRKALYIKYAKEIPRPILEEAYRFVVDSNARNKGALFMWKLREMGVFEKFKLSPPARRQKPAAAKTGSVYREPGAKTARSKTKANQKPRQELIICEDELFSAAGEASKARGSRRERRDLEDELLY